MRLLEAILELEAARLDLSYRDDKNALSCLARGIEMLRNLYDSIGGQHLVKRR